MEYTIFEFSQVCGMETGSGYQIVKIGMNCSELCVEDGTTFDAQMWPYWAFGTFFQNERLPAESMFIPEGIWK
jgi:hypothetical protein